MLSTAQRGMESRFATLGAKDSLATALEASLAAVSDAESRDAKKTKNEATGVTLLKSNLGRPYESDPDSPHDDATDLKSTREVGGTLGIGRESPMPNDPAVIQHDAATPHSPDPPRTFDFEKRFAAFAELRNSTRSDPEVELLLDTTFAGELAIVVTSLGDRRIAVRLRDDTKIQRGLDLSDLFRQFREAGLTVVRDIDSDLTFT